MPGAWGGQEAELRLASSQKAGGAVFPWSPRWVWAIFRGRKRIQDGSKLEHIPGTRRLEAGRAVRHLGGGVGSGSLLGDPKVPWAQNPLSPPPSSQKQACLLLWGLSAPSLTVQNGLENLGMQRIRKEGPCVHCFLSGSELTHSCTAAWIPAGTFSARPNGNIRAAGRGRERPASRRPGEVVRPLSRGMYGSCPCDECHPSWDAEALSPA